MKIILPKAVATFCHVRLLNHIKADGATKKREKPITNKCLLRQSTTHWRGLVTKSIKSNLVYGKELSSLISHQKFTGLLVKVKYSS